MKILAAFDSFKESMSAIEAGEAVRKATNHEVIIKPLADGGEGTLDTLNEALNGKIHKIKVTGPLFEDVYANIAIIDKLAIIESAQSCGLDLVDMDKRNGLKTTTKGVGEMIEYAYNKGCNKIYLTLGGSSTNDGGIGMLSSLGISFLNKNNEELKPIGENLAYISKIDISNYKLKNKEIEIIGLCDVSNELCGKNGATYIYGPQKNVPLNLLEKTDDNMKKYASLTKELFHYDYSIKEGAGAAGGLGFAIISYLNGKLISGFNEIAKLIELEDAIKNCDIIFTGEGKIDSQTLNGKVLQGVLNLAKKHHKKVVAFAGKVEDRELLKDNGFLDVICISNEDKPLKELLKEGQINLEKEVRKYLKNV